MVDITPGKAYGFFTDTSVCIGCKACEVACKQWNLLQGNPPVFGDGYDNTCLLYTSPSPRDRQKSRMPSSA